MKDGRYLRILFIGNSHTYYQDMPALAAALAKEDGYDCDVTMIAHPGWYLYQHMDEPDVQFNIRYGCYDYVVLQEHSHPFDSIPEYRKAATVLAGWVRGAGGTPVIYGTWSRKDEEEAQETMNRVNRELAQSLHAVYAAVGESWWSCLRSRPEIEMYCEDGAHASQHGMEFVSKVIWTAIREDLQAKEKQGQ